MSAHNGRQPSDKGDRPLRLGVEIGWDPTWPAGLLYSRNLIYTLAAVEPGRRPLVRLLPVDSASAEKVRDLAQLDFVQATASDRAPWVTEPGLLMRRAIRRWVQPRVGRPLHPAFMGLDVSYPGFGTPIPGTPQMQWIPDFQHVHLPHLFQQSAIDSRNQRFKAIAEADGVVILSSNAAADDFRSAFPNARALPRVWNFCTTIPDEELRAEDPRPRFGLPTTYLYVANQFWAHKEHLTLFRALALLRERGVEPVVVCSGLMRDGRDPQHVPRLMAFLAENGLEEQVKMLGFLDRATQIGVLRHCAAVVQPSAFEGWSTVVEDAKAIGRPIVLSDLPVHLEQAPDAHFFELGSVEGLADVLERTLPMLEPGPDHEAEARAREATDLRRRELGELFVSIAHEAIALGRRSR